LDLPLDTLRTSGDPVLGRRSRRGPGEHPQADGPPAPEGVLRPRWAVLRRRDRDVRGLGIPAEPPRGLRIAPQDRGSGVVSSDTTALYLPGGCLLKIMGAP